MEEILELHAIAKMEKVTHHKKPSRLDCKFYNYSEGLGIELNIHLGRTQS